MSSVVAVGKATPPRPAKATTAPRAARARRRGVRLGWVAGRVWSWLWPPVVVFAVFVAVWWVWIDVRDVASVIAPHPVQVATTFITRGDTLARNLAVTGAEAGLGYLLGTAVALLSGVLISMSKHCTRGVLPWLFAVESLPKIAFGPLLIIWFGFDRSPKVVLAAIMCIFIVMYQTVNGLRSTPVELLDVARSLCGSRIKTWVKVRLPYALPHIFVGLKIGAPLALIGAVLGEFLSADEGLGWLIATAVSDTPLVFAALAVLSVMSMALTGAVALVERWSLPWVKATRG